MTTLTNIEAFIAAQPMYDRRRRFWRPTVRNLLRFIMHIDDAGQENIPAAGPTILMMNHMTLYDPVVTTAVVKHRYVISMAKAELLNNWFTRQVIQRYGQFVVHRAQVDRAALNNAIALLQSGQLVLIAPEGTRHPDTGLQEPHDGLVYIAHKADAVVVPTAVVGLVESKGRLKRLRRMRGVIRFGRAFKFAADPHERISKSTRAAMMREAMYQLALAIPADHARSRGQYAAVEQATTEHLQFIEQR